MTNWIRIANLVIAFSGLTLCCIGLVNAALSRQLENKTRKYFIRFFSILIAYVTFNLLGQTTDGHYGIGWAVFSRFTLFSESLFSSILTVFLTGFMLHESGETDLKHRRSLRAAVAIWAIYVVMLLTTQWMGAFYYINDDNIYSRGPLYPLLLLPVVLIMLINLILLILLRSGLSKRERTAFAIYILVPLGSMMLQMLLFGIYFIVLGSCIAASAMLAFIIADQSERFFRQKNELEHLQMEILLSQIRPHFLYNVLGAIKELCTSDPKAAEDAIVCFSTYLRGNMESFEQTEPVPFAQELEHTRVYLELEKLRFESGLIVIIDTPYTGFRIPVLTMQPIVENAVRYGVRGIEREVGTVRISTAEYPDRIEVTVEDDGPGFDEEKAAAREDGRLHLGISNVRRRMHDMVGGDLKIESGPEHGTKAILTIPKGGRLSADICH